MLLSKIVQPKDPLNPWRLPFFGDSTFEDLGLLVEGLRLRMQNWHGLDYEKFGSLRMYGNVTVGKSWEQTQALICYLFEHILILTKERSGSKWPTIRVRGSEVNRCSLKGSILFRRHLTGLSVCMTADRQDSALRLHLSVAELPNLYFRFENEVQRERWQTAIGDLAFGPNAYTVGSFII
jgi:hypothetical protein